MQKTVAIGLFLFACLGCQETFGHSPTGIVVDNKGNVYFLKFLLSTDEARERSQLWKIDSDGTLTNIPFTLDGKKLSLSRPHKLAIDSRGTLYLSGFVKVSPDGSVSKMIYPEELHPFWDSPLAVDPQGNFYCESIVRKSKSSPQLNRLARLDTDGEVHIVAGSTRGLNDGTGGDAQFVHIGALAVGPSGDLFVVDGDRATGSWIRRVTREGKVTTIAGSRKSGFADGRGGAARFRSLGGLAVDKKGNLYVADPDNSRIRKVTADGVITTLAGSGVSGHADGPASEASFDSPSGVAVGPNGDVYVLEGSPRRPRVRRISPDGKVSTIATVPGLRSDGVTDGVDR